MYSIRYFCESSASQADRKRTNLQRISKIYYMWEDMWKRMGILWGKTNADSVQVRYTSPVDWRLFGWLVNFWSIFVQSVCLAHMIACKGHPWCCRHLKGIRLNNGVRSSSYNDFCFGDGDGVETGGGPVRETRSFFKMVIVYRIYGGKMKLVVNLVKRTSLYTLVLEKMHIQVEWITSKELGVHLMSSG